MNRAEWLLAVPALKEHDAYPSISLGGEWKAVTTLRALVDGSLMARGDDGNFSDVPAGIYKLLTE